jgi:mannose-6-phosphate isomerase
MKTMHQKFVVPSVDMGGTKVAFAFIRVGKKRSIARRYPSEDVVRADGQPDVVRTLDLAAKLILKRTREMEKTGWTVLKLVGMGAPGLYLDDNSVDPKSIPNLPDLAKIKPAILLEEKLGKDWKVFINNDGAVQAVAAGYAFTRSPGLDKKRAALLGSTGGRMIYFGPGTGFGAGKVRLRQDKRVETQPGSQSFFDLLIRDGKTAELLIGGHGIGAMAQKKERANLAKGRPVFLTQTDGFGDWDRATGKQTDAQLAKISGKTVARAYLLGNREAKRQAREIFEQAGKDLAALMINLHEGRGKKTIITWDKSDWLSVKGTRIFLVAGLLAKPTGRGVILPAVRAALKKAGYGKKIELVEIDQLPGMKKVTDNIGVFGASLIIPEKEIREGKWASSLQVGKANINRFIVREVRKACQKLERPVLLSMDGYCGVEWEKTIPQIKRRLEKEGMRVTAINVAAVFKSRKKIEQMIQGCLAHDKIFGRIFDGKMADFLDEVRLEKLAGRLEKFKQQTAGKPRVVICFGPGAACSPLGRLCDMIFYRDLTREEIVKRTQKGLVAPLGAGARDEARKGQPAYLAGKRFHYVDFPVLDKHKKSIQKQIHFYLDDNLAKEPKLIHGALYEEMVTHLVQGPFQLKAYHDQGVWGGQWLRKIRHLPKDKINYAWAYELMAYHMSVEMPVGDTYIETPFANILDREADRVMGGGVRRRFKGGWPIRVNYDDCWKGGDMAIQVHPDAAYIKKKFNESLHQDESYYIVAAEPDAFVYLGLKEDLEMDAFHDAVRKAETEGIPFDHRQFVNVFPAKEGDLFLIPAGTVHAAGKGCVVLELSSTTDRYTFHFYDYLRPDLHGKLRDIHSAHAFQMANKYPHRRSSWVKKHLIQKPRLVRKGKGWAEYLIGKLDGYLPEVHRFEIRTSIDDHTEGVPHVLSLVKGEGVVIEPAAESSGGAERKFELNFAETVIIPARIGPYTITNRGSDRATVLKTLVNPSW